MNRIRAIRDRLGVTQVVLGQAAGRPQATVSRWESGQAVPDLLDIKAICEFARGRGIALQLEDFVEDAAA